MRSRRVFVHDLQRHGAGGTPSNIKVDRALSRRQGYEIVDRPLALDFDLTRIAALYRGPYLGKHSRLNPDYTRRFLRLILESYLFECRALLREGHLDGFVVWHTSHGVLVGNMLGYDLTKPRQIGLYRQLFAILIAESRRQRLPLHLSAGPERFKRLRGGLPVEEYEAVFARHLAARCRSAWRLVSTVVGAGARRSVDR